MSSKSVRIEDMNKKAPLSSLGNHFEGGGAFMFNFPVDGETSGIIPAVVRS